MECSTVSLIVEVPMFPMYPQARRDSALTFCLQSALCAFTKLHKSFSSGTMSHEPLLSGHIPVQHGGASTIFRPAKVAKGVVGLTLAAMAGFAASGSRLFRRNNLAFFPKQGVSAVLVHPEPPMPLDYGHLTEAQGVFVYDSNEMVPENIAFGGKQEEAVAYGVKMQCGICITRVPIMNAVPTGRVEDVVKGRLIAWPNSLLANRLREADKQWGKRRRVVIPVVKKEGNSVKAHMYFEDLGAMRWHSNDAKDVIAFTDKIVLPDFIETGRPQTRVSSLVASKKSKKFAPEVDEFDTLDLLEDWEPAEPAYVEPPLAIASPGDAHYAKLEKAKSKNDKAAENMITGSTCPLATTASRRSLSFFSVGDPSPAKMLQEKACFEGRTTANPQAPERTDKHYVLKTPLYGPWPDGYEEVSLGLGCFWCSESLFWNKKLFPKLEGVYSTQVGYQNGVTRNPSYQEVCTGRTNHNEVTRIVYDPKVTPFKEILKVFWEHHDPTSPMRQGNDRGTQYRSGIYYTTQEQKKEAEASKAEYQKLIEKAGHGKIVTEIVPAGPFYYAELYHQQYDAKPGSRQYCGLAPLGVKLP
eukprot:g11490.t1